MEDPIDKRVTVAIRVRPKIATATNATQMAEYYHPETVVKLSDITLRVADATSITDPSSTGGSAKPRVNSFNFDYIFDKDSPQLEVYEEVALDAVDGALQCGANASILTYGQTGSGKTHTILGAVGKNPLSDDVITPNTGIFLRVLRDILAFAESQRKTRHVVVVLSVTEVYLDLVKDLLQGTPGSVVVGSGGVNNTPAAGNTNSAASPTLKPQASTLSAATAPGVVKVIIDGETVRIPELAHRPIENLRDAVNAYTVATSRRIIRATDANDSSSRSHALFTVDIFQQRRIEDVNPEPLPTEAYLALRDFYGTAAAAPPSSSAHSSPQNNLARKPSMATLARKPSSAGMLSPTEAEEPGSPTSASSLTSLPVDPLLATPPILMGKASNPIIKVNPKTIHNALQQAQSAYAANNAAAVAAAAAAAANRRGGNAAPTASAGAPPSPTGPNHLATAIGVTSALPPVVFSRIVLTDLAGSEKQKHSGATGESFEEMKKINASLTALGNVVHALFCGSSHVPYRDAKLTVLLRPSFATPFSKIVLIANCAPTSLTFDETMSTIFFADKVKVMKVDGAGMNAAGSAAAADAIRQEAELLKIAKRQEELVAEMRILKGGYGGYAPLVRRSLVSGKKSPEDVSPYFSTIGHARTTKAMVESGGKNPILALIEAGPASALEEAQTHAAALQKKEDEDIKRESEELRKTLVDDQVKAYKQRREVLEQELESNERMSVERIQELDAAAVRLEGEIAVTEKENEITDKEIIRCMELTEDRLVPKVDTCTEEEAELEEKLETLEKAFAEKYKDEQAIWQAETTLQKTRDINYVRVKKFWKARLEYNLLRLQYVGITYGEDDEAKAALQREVKAYWTALEEYRSASARQAAALSLCATLSATMSATRMGATFAGGEDPLSKTVTMIQEQNASLLDSEYLLSEIHKLNKDGEMYDIRHWVKEAVLVIARNAVTRAMKNAKKAGAIAAPVTRPAFVDPTALVATTGAASAHFTSTPQASFNRDAASTPYPVARPPARDSLTIVTTDLSDPSVNPYATLRPSTTFDNPALIRQIHSYMMAGCSLLKYNRKRSPHFRYFALHIDEAKSLLRLYWAPEDVVVAAGNDGGNTCSILAQSSKSNFLDLFSVTKVVLGRGVDSNKTAAAISPNDEDYYKTFAIHYIKAGEGERVLEVTAETIAEMEAWVIGVCSVSRCNPRFERMMVPNSSKDLAASSSVNEPAVVEILTKWHIQPDVWASTETQLRAMGAKLALSKMAASLKNATPAGRPTPAATDDDSISAVPPTTRPPASTTATPAAFIPAVITPGVLRQMMKLDIFRATAAWYGFVGLGVLAGVPADDATGLPQAYLEFEEEDKSFGKGVKK